MKPLLVGEANPYQSDPVKAQHYALFPDPPNCAGWNLCHRVMQLDEVDYLARFDRVNLCAGKWNTQEARSRADWILSNSPLKKSCDVTHPNDDAPDGAAFGNLRRSLDVWYEVRPIILLGKRVTDCFHVSFEKFTIRHPDRATLVILPHPSGLSRAWNEPGAYERARAVLREAGVL